jgi:enoyl-CoA hydratase
LKAIGTASGNRLAAGGDGPMGPTRMVLSKPVIAAVDGYAVAGGLELALWCDLRVAAEDAVFGVFCRRWGVPLVDGGTVRLPRLIGSSRAMDLVLTGRAVTAAEALDIGLVNRVVPNAAPEIGKASRVVPSAAPEIGLVNRVVSALPAARQLAAEIAALPQTCLRHDRLSLLEQHGLTESEAMANEYRHGQVSIADVASGLAKFAAGEGRHGA